MGDRVWPQVPEAPLTPREAAQIAGQAYRESSFKDGAEPFRKVPDGGEVKVLGRKFIVLERDNDPTTGLDAYLLKDPPRDFGVVAYRATEGFSVAPKAGPMPPLPASLGLHPDYAADAEYGAGFVPRQAQLASEKFRHWLKKYQGVIGHWVVTGHSLGGMDAQFVLAQNGKNIDFSYNVSGSEMYVVFSEQQKRLARLHSGKLYNLGSQRDWIYMLNRTLDAPQWGHTAYMDIADSGGMDPIKFHHLDGRFRFDGDGNPVTLDPKVVDEFLTGALGPDV